MSRRVIALIVVVNLLLVAGIVWLVWPRGEESAPPARVEVPTQTETYVRPRPTRPPPDGATTTENTVRVGPLTAVIPPGFDARGRVYGKTIQALYFPKDPKSRRTAAILLTPAKESLGRRVRTLTSLSPGITNPPRIVRLRTTDIAGQSAGFAVTDRRVKSSRAVILINRGRYAISVDAMGPQAEAARTTRTALAIARSLKVE